MRTRRSSCTDREVAAFTGLSRKTVERIREKLGIRKYHKWTGKDFAVIHTTRRNGYEAKTAALLIGVTPKSLWSAIERNPHLAA